MTVLLMMVSLFTGVMPRHPVAADEITNKAENNKVYDVKSHSENECHVVSTLENKEIDDTLIEMLDLYFKIRESAFCKSKSSAKNFSSMDLEACIKDKAMLSKETARENAYSYLLKKNIYVTDSVTEARIEEINNITENQLELSVYEWTWLDYTNEQGIVSDQMGFGTTHTIIVEKQENGSYVIIKDNYDDSDMTGAGLMEITNEVYEAPAESAVLEDEGTEALPMDQEISNFNPLNVEAVISYADQYIKMYANGGNDPDGYNSEYGYFPGEDCANYVSQCLYTGGLPMDDNWKFHYKNENGTPNCTDSWCGAISLHDYLVGTCKYSAVSATASTLFPGNPVWSNTSYGHVGICVGYNSSGVPVFNAHTKNRYHIPYTFFSNPQTVHIVTYNKWCTKPGSAMSLTVTTSNQSSSLCMHPGVSSWFKFTTIASGTYTFFAEAPQINLGVQATLYETIHGESEMNPLASDKKGAGNGCFRISMFLAAGKTYYLRVYANSYGASGNFTLYYKWS